MYSLIYTKFTVFCLLTAILIYCPLNATNLILNEISDAATKFSEFIEIKNLTGTDINISNYKFARITKNSSNTSYVFEIGKDGGGGDTIVPANGYLVVSQGDGRSVFLNNFPEFPENSAFYIGSVALQIAGKPSGWRWQLIDHNDNIVDDTNMETSGVDKRTIQISLGTFETSFSISGEHSTPGTSEDVVSLPVTLNYFNAKLEQESVLLEWATSAEIDNLGFNIYRKSDEGNYLLLSGFENNDQLKGHGSISEISHYSFIDNNIIIGKVYTYMLSDVDYYLHETRFSELAQSITISYNIDLNPYKFHLSDAYPNPFNPTTTLQYRLPGQSNVSIIVYNILGRKIKEWNLDNQHAGLHSIVWDGTNSTGQKVSTGIYTYQMISGDFIETKKMVFMK